LAGPPGPGGQEKSYIDFPGYKVTTLPSEGNASSPPPFKREGESLDERPS